MFHGSSAEVLMRESRVFGAFFVKTYRRADSGLMIWRMGTRQKGTSQVMVGFQCPEAAKLYLYLRGTSGVA